MQIYHASFCLNDKPELGIEHNYHVYFLILKLFDRFSLVLLLRSLKSLLLPNAFSF